MDMSDFTIDQLTMCEREQLADYIIELRDQIPEEDVDELKSEIERLKEEQELAINTLTQAQENDMMFGFLINTKEEEIKKLKEENERLKDVIRAKAEAEVLYDKTKNYIKANKELEAKVHYLTIFKENRNEEIKECMGEIKELKKQVETTTAINKKYMALMQKHRDEIDDL